MFSARLGSATTSLTLAVSVGEAATMRYDRRGMAEIRIFYQDTFLCRAIYPALAGEDYYSGERVRWERCILKRARQI